MLKNKVLGENKEMNLILIIINEKLNEIMVEKQDKNILILEILKIYENLI